MRRMWIQILWWWRRDREEQELAEEMRAHIAIEARERLESGCSAEEAEFAARRAFGNRARITEETRDVWRAVWLEQLWQDIHYGLRSLRRTPVLTLAVIATFALGIGANTALFSVIYTVLLKPLPYQYPERLVWITEDTALAPLGSPRQRQFTNMLVTSDLLGWKNAQVFDGIASFSIFEETLTMNDEAWYPRVARSSEPLSKIPGVPPVLGRDFLPEELEPGAAGVALLSDLMYRQRFSSDPNLIGKSITIGGQPFTVIGVMPATFRLPWPTEGQTQFEAEVIVNEPIRPTNPYLEGAVARLKAGATIEAAHAQLTAIAKGNDEQGKTQAEVIGRDVRIEPLHERIVGAVRFRLLVLWAAVGFVLLIACVNVTNLLLSRAATRAREVAIRSALGAGRMRLIRQQLTESVALALTGGMTGAGLATVGMRILAGSTPPEIPRLRDAAVDGNALAFTFAVCAITGIVSGLASALTASGTRPADALKATPTGAVAGSPWRRRTHSVLVVSELALAMVLTAGAGLMVKSLWRMDAGMADSEQVFTTRVELAGYSLTSGDRDRRLAQIEARRRYVADTVEQIEALPGVTAAALWLTGFGAGAGFGPRGIARIDGNEPADMDVIPATLHYFTVAGMGLQAGRFFTEEDGSRPGRPVIVNEAFLRPYGLSPASAVGMYLGYADDMGAPEDPARALRIVGVVSDLNTRPDQPAPPQAFGPLGSIALAFGGGYLWVRTSGDPMAVARQIHRILTRDRATVMIGGETLADQMSACIAPRRFQGALLISFAAMALLLALVGTYGVLNYSVSERTREIGVRIALGAARRDVMRMILRRGLGLAIAGIILGTGGTLALTRVIGSFVFGVEPTDPWTYVAVCGVMLAVALGAASLPALRAMRVDPMEALRCE